MSADRSVWFPVRAVTAEPAGASIAPSGPRELRLAGASYLLACVSGLVVLFAAGRRHRYARWHAVQSIGFGFVALFLAGGLSALAYLALQAVGGVLPLQREAPWFSLAVLVGLMAMAFILVFASEAARGRSIRIPVVAAIADRLA